MKIVILGNKYKLTAYDLKNLKNHTIYHLPFPKEDEISKYEAIFKQLFQKKKIDIVVFNFDYPLPSALNTLFAKAKGEGITFLTIYHFVEKYCFKLLYLSKKDEENLLDEVKRYTKLQYCIKRVIDYMISIPLFVGTLPIMLYSIYRIKKESPGPIFFIQNRIGINNRSFKCFKFRSMHEKSIFFDHYTQDDDPRVFSWGKVMRKFRIDELPQLINVLKGDMHLIGPRAEWDKLVYKYEKEIDFYNMRHIVKPGITGWAQVNYPYGRNIEDTKEKLMYDLYYIKNWSLWIEFKTIIKTIFVIMGKKGV